MGRSTPPEETPPEAPVEVPAEAPVEAAEAVEAAPAPEGPDAALRAWADANGHADKDNEQLRQYAPHELLAEYDAAVAAEAEADAPVEDTPEEPSEG